VTVWTPGYTDVTHVGIADRLLPFFSQRTSQFGGESLTTDLSPSDTHQGSASSERGDALAADGTTTQRDITALLEAAMQAGDVQIFIQMVDRIDWSQQSPADFVSAVHLALAAGAHLTARQLAIQGHRLYPEHPDLDKMAYILAPSQAQVVKRPPHQTPGTPNFDWLREHSAHYRGMWVALREGQLLAAAPTVRELKNKLDLTNKGIFFARVP
jgi:hypothetical protein